MATLPEDPMRSTEQARADALLAALSFASSADASSAEDDATPEDKSSAGADVLVHVDVEALAGQGGEADLPLPMIKRLCCDGGIVAVYISGQQILNVGRRQRTVPVAIRRALSARDRACRFPGCHHRHYLHAHHIQHWADGRETSLNNLIQLCSHHHKLVHEGRFQLKTAGDKHYFARPDGRPVEASGTE